MRLTSADGTWFDLRLLRRQVVEVPGVRLDDRPFAADWLVVRGEVRTTDGLHWTFREPCLSTWEGQRLGSWLRAAAGDADGPTVARGAALRFADPMLSLVLDDARADRRLLRVHLTGAAARPDPRDGAPRESGLALDVRAAALVAAADEWAGQLAAGG